MSRRPNENSTDSRPSKRSRTETTNGTSTEASAPVDGEEFKILQNYRDVNNDLSKDRAEVARNGDVTIAVDRLRVIDNLFGKLNVVNANRNSLLAQDSKAVLNISELTQLSVRNLKLDESQRIFSVNDIVNYSKRYMLKEYFNLNGIVEERADLRTGGETEPQDAPEDAPNDTANQEDEYAQMRNERSSLQQFDRYDQFGQFNWFKMGMLFQSISKSPLTVDHLLGPFAAEKKVRAPSQRVRTQDAVGQAKTADRVTGDSLSSTQEATTPELVKRCFKILTDKIGYKQINLFKFIIDPQSFAKSVENLFYTSFLIKEGKIVLEEDADGYPAIRRKDKLPKGELERNMEIQLRNTARQNHIIFQLDMATWRKLIERFDIKTAFIPNGNELSGTN